MLKTVISSRVLFRAIISLIVIFMTCSGAFNVDTVKADTSLVVMNANDSGSGSLRQAILLAKPYTPTIITFSAYFSNYCATNDNRSYAICIFLSAPIQIPNSLDITIRGSGVIEDGSAVLIRPNSDASGYPSETRLFDNQGGNLTLYGLGLYYGNAKSGNGGLVLNQGTLTINHCILEFGKVRAGLGGAIYNAPWSDLKISYSNFIANSAYPAVNRPGDGGAIYNDRSAVTVDHSTFSGNVANDDVVLNIAIGIPLIGGGGAIYNNHGSLSIKSSLFQGNQATITVSDFNGEGGAIYNAGTGSTATIDSSTLSGNIAYSAGGAIYNGRANDEAFIGGGLVNIVNSTLTGNSSTFTAGAISDETSPINIINSTLADNVTQGTSALGLTLIGGDSVGYEGLVFPPSPSPISVQNSIISDVHSRPANLSGNCSGHLTDHSYNLEQSNTGSGSCGINYEVLIYLLPISDNGGPTPTIALASDIVSQSVAINAIPPDKCVVTTR